MPETMIAQPKRSGIPVWVWGVIGVVLLLVIAGGVYFAFGRRSAPAVASTAAVSAAKPTTVVTKAAAVATAAPSNKLAGAVNLPGSYQNYLGCAAQWDPACPATSMKKGNDGKYTLTVELPAGNYQFKIAMDGNWTVNYGSDGKQDGPNYLLKVAANGPVTFVYDPALHIVTTSSKAAAIATAVPPNVLIATGTLPVGGQMLSNNKLYRFEVHADGELVLYNNYSNKTMWSSKSKGDPKALVMQNDGNLVLVAKDSSVIWASGKTGPKGDYFLALQDDGNLVVYQGIYQSPKTKPIWATNTAR